jgi:BirA family transcriptional regulator, biotin operon repressor / biotin---[acetyl-CoA-carboxylase] ligase
VSDGRVRVSVRQARRLRRDSTDAERKLWLALRNRGVAGAKSCRQVPVGPYIRDFVCKEAKLIVEVDGGQHNEVVDRHRTRQLATKGYRILRFWNNDVTANMGGVLLTISDALERRS